MLTVPDRHTQEANFGTDRLVRCVPSAARHRPGLESLLGRAVVAEVEDGHAGRVNGEGVEWRADMRSKGEQSAVAVANRRERT